VDEYARRVHIVGIDGADRQDVLLDLDQSAACA
jgi:hypothetical protein